MERDTRSRVLLVLVVLTVVVGTIPATVAAQSDTRTGGTVVGGLVNLLVFLLGLGALTVGVYSHLWSTRGRDRDPRGEVSPDGPTMD